MYWFDTAWFLVAGHKQTTTTVKKNTDNSKGKFLSPSPISLNSEAHKKGFRVYLKICFYCKCLPNMHKLVYLV